MGTAGGTDGVEWRSTDTSFRSLPDDIQRSILATLPTSKLLNNCRLVSSTWRIIGSEICRKRYVKFKNDDTDIPSNCHPGVFSDITNLPWSTIDLYFYSFGNPSAVFVASTYGNQIRGLTLILDNSCDYNTALHVLSLVPNLDTLDIILTEYHGPAGPPTPSKLPEFEFPSNWVTSLQLPKLEYLSIYSKELRRKKLRKYDTDFLQFIMRHVVGQRKLKMLDVRVCKDMSPADLMEFAPTILKKCASQLHVHVPYTGPSPGWETVVSQAPYTVKLLTATFTGTLTDHFHFQSFQQLLVGCAELTQLQLNFRLNGVSPVTVLALPTLVNLVVLKLYVKSARGRRDDQKASDYLTLSPLTPNCLPKLKCVSVKLGSDRSDTVQDDATMQNWFDQPFNNVKELGLYYGHFGGAKSVFETFPNLRILKRSIGTAEEVEEIAVHLTGLEDLELHLSGDNLASTNFHFVGRIIKSLQKLYALTKLTLSTKKSFELGDSCGILFMLLHPLELTFRSSDVEQTFSEECIVKLRSYHHRFQLKELD